MVKRKGFTVVEILVVVLIVGVLLAIAVPIMRGRVDAAKWVEGRTMAENLARSLRQYAQEQGTKGSYGEGQPSLTELGHSTADLTGNYFDYTNFTWITDYQEGRQPPLDFSITVSAPEGISSPSVMTLDNKDEWRRERR
jgi:prepilin-type N-terminal cleavage/methylation domain-containing protein